jgi:hypothetical protein
MRLHGFGRTTVATLAVLAGLGLTAPRTAAGQAIGDPVPFGVTSGTGVVLVLPAGCDGYLAQALGGITLFGSHSPSGSYVGVLPQRTRLNGEGQPECPAFIIPGVPPGTYWVTVVYGFVSTENVAVSAWQPITVAGACTRAPSPPVLLPGQPVITGDDVSVAFASPPDCGANEMVLEVGLQPGAIDLPPITVGSLAFAVNDVPPGTYYLRARSRNPYGESKPSTVVPIRVPGGCTGVPGLATPQAPLNPTVTKNGNVVTLSWSQTPGVASTPTFYVISIKNPSSGLTLDNLVIPAQTSISAALGPGAYRVGIASGNACGTTSPITGDLTFTVP